jgi:hypothetical protein
LLAKLLAASVLLLPIASGGAVACQAKNTTPVLDDTFKIPDPGWGPPDDIATFSPAGLVLKPPVNGSAWRWNPNYSIDGYDLCVSVINPAQIPIQATGRLGDIGDVGVWFWGQNPQNFYTATLSLNGTVSIDRLVNGTWQIIMAPTMSGAVRTSPGATNEIEVAVRGNTGTFFLNGMKILDFRGEPPARGGPPGVYGESGSAPVSWLFSRVQLF